MLGVCCKQLLDRSMHSKVFYGLFTIEVIETVFIPPETSASSPEKSGNVFYIYLF